MISHSQRSEATADVRAALGKTRVETDGMESGAQDRVIFRVDPESGAHRWDPHPARPDSPVVLTRRA